jgi:hypothetical protein
VFLRIKKIISLNVIIRLIFVMEIPRVFLEVGTDFLNVSS